MIAITFEDKKLRIFWEGDLVKEAAAFLFKRDLKTLPSLASRDELQSWIYEIEKKSAKNYALYLLSRRSYHSDVLKEKLKSQGVSSLIIKPLIEEMKNLGYLRDEEYLKAWVSSEMKKGRGKLAIFARSKQKGFAGAKVDALLQEMFPENLQKESALLQIKKLQKRGYPREKILRSLIRKGFSYSLVSSSFSSSSEDF